jgi:carboxymethylenebutenolidase
MTKEAAVERRGRLDENVVLADLTRAIESLRSTPEALVGVVGFCMGGTLALDIASSGSGVASVAYYGFPATPNGFDGAPPRPIDLVSRLSGPVLAFWGDQDATVGIDTVEKYVAAASAARADFNHRVLAGLGHGFLGEADLDDRDDPASKTWQETLAFFALHLHAGAREPL